MGTDTRRGLSRTELCGGKATWRRRRHVWWLHRAGLAAGGVPGVPKPLFLGGSHRGLGDGWPQACSGPYRAASSQSWVPQEQGHRPRGGRGDPPSWPHPALGQLYSRVPHFSWEKQPKATVKGVLGKCAGAPQIRQPLPGPGEGCSPLSFLLQCGGQGSLPVLPLCVTPCDSQSVSEVSFPRPARAPGPPGAPRLARAGSPQSCTTPTPSTPSAGGRARGRQ